LFHANIFDSMLSYVVSNSSRIPYIIWWHLRCRNICVNILSRVICRCAFPYIAVIVMWKYNLCQYFKIMSCNCTMSVYTFCWTFKLPGLWLW